MHTHLYKFKEVVGSMLIPIDIILDINSRVFTGVRPPISPFLIPVRLLFRLIAYAFSGLLHIRIV